MRSKLRTILLALAAAFILACIALIALTSDRATTLPPLPNPNGYDDFFKAGELLSGFLDLRTATGKELYAHVKTNAAVLQLVREGLSKDCLVPIDNAGTNRLGHRARLKTMATLLAAEGKLAEIEDRPTDAARSYVDTIRFGSEISRGGNLMDRLIGAACEAIGYNPLVRLAPKLSQEQQHLIVSELAKIDAKAASWKEVRHIERYSARQELKQSFNPIKNIQSWWQVWRAMRLAEERHNKGVARLRLLMTELALRCHQAEHGTPPAQLAELVPQYLPRVPQDPFSRQALVYRAKGTNWLLYSVGPDRRDNDGAPAGRGTAKGDLFFDSPW